MNAASYFVEVPKFAPPVRIEPDRSLTAAHLLLLAPGRRDGLWAGDDIPNLAKTQARAILGADNEKVRVFNTFTSSESGQVERTLKNRPHFMVSRTKNTSGGAAGLGAGAGLQMETVLRDYLQARASLGTWYLGIAFRSTGDGYLGTSPSVFPIASIKSPSSLDRSQVSVGIQSTGALAGTPGSSDAKRLGFTQATHPSDPAEKFVAVTSKGFTMTTAVSTILAFIGAYNADTIGKAPSVAIGRVALADLSTVPGLTHAKMVEADLAEWSASLSVGGYYKGDAMSVPSLIVP